METITYICALRVFYVIENIEVCVIGTTTASSKQCWVQNMAENPTDASSPAGMHESGCLCVCAGGWFGRSGQVEG